MSSSSPATPFGLSSLIFGRDAHAAVFLSMFCLIDVQIDVARRGSKVWTCWLQDIRGEGSKGGKALLAEFERPLLQWKSRLGEFVTLLYHAPAVELRYQCASISRSRCDRSAGSQLRFAADIPCITPRPAMYAFSAQRYCLSSLNSHTVLIFFEPGLGLDWESRGGKSDSGITIDQREVLHRQTPIIVHSSPENDYLRRSREDFRPRPA